VTDREAGGQFADKSIAKTAADRSFAVHQLHRRDKAVSPPRGLSDLSGWLFAAERIDTWVFRVGVAVPAVCITVLVVWHLIGLLTGKNPKRRRKVRESPEPPFPFPPKSPPPAPTPADTTAGDAPDQLRQACMAAEESLARTYLGLAESCLRTGQPREAAAALKKLLRVFPEGDLARLAQDRLRQLGDGVEDRSS
jgi:hypothetical protein